VLFWIPPNDKVVPSEQFGGHFRLFQLNRQTVCKRSAHWERDRMQEVTGGTIPDV
jgi:hypothetical protein